MSWAQRRRFLYISGIILFFVVVVGGPVAYKIATIPQTCHDGKQDQGRPSSVTFGPDGRMYVANDANGTIFWIAPM